MTNLRKRSVKIIKENQHENGAYIASPNFTNYHYSWLRDGTFIAYSMDVVGEHQSAEAFYGWAHRSITKHESKARAAFLKEKQGLAVTEAELLHTRYTLDGQEGDEEWPNFQLDGYGTWLWGLAEHINYTGNTELIKKFQTSILLTLEYIVTFWSRPNYDSWEEFGEKVHPSTLACLFGGVKSVSKYLDGGEGWDGLAQTIKGYILEHFTQGSRFNKFDDTLSVDANLLWIALPFAVVNLDESLMINTVKEIEKRLVFDGGGVHRYPQDTYYGGGLWILLAAWLGWYYAQSGDLGKAKRQQAWIERQQTANGKLPEQVASHLNDPSYYQPWVNKWGEIASPLLWSHAMYLVLDNAVKKAGG